MCVACLLGSGAPFRVGPGEGSAADGPFPAAPEPFPLAGAASLGLSVTWTGVAGFVLEHSGVRIAFDPFVSRPGLWATLVGRPQSDAAAVARAFSGLAAVFVGHAHFDHALDLPAVAAASPLAQIVGGPTMVELCRRQGVDPARLRAVSDGELLEVGPFRVETVRSEHGRVPIVGWVDRLHLPEAGLPWTPFRYPRGEVLAWRVEVGGHSVWMQGSAGLDDAALARQEPVDVLVACLAARAGTRGYLERLGERLRPRVLVPCHHDDFFRPLGAAPAPIRTLRWSSFRQEARTLERAYGTLVWRPTRGHASAW